MKLYRKLVLFALAAAVAPLVGVGFAVVGATQRALQARIAAEQTAVARFAAEGIASDLSQLDRTLRSMAGSFDPDRLSPAELRGLLALVVSDATGAAAAALVDPRGVPRAFLERGGTAGAFPGSGGEVFLRQVQAGPDAPGGLVLSVYVDPARGPQIAVVRAVPAGGGRAWRLGARLPLEGAVRRLEAAAGSAGAAFLVDGDGAVLAASGRGADHPPDRAALAGLLGAAPRAGTLDGEGGRALAAFAPVSEGGGLGVVMRLPEPDAYAEVTALRRTVLLASLAVLGVVLALAGWLARALGSGLSRIEEAARALGSGDLSVRLPPGGADEIGAVSRTFNAMAEELAGARGRLERWNEELQREVEARARALREAQGQVVEAQKLAAIGQLGAGVAHEINNPLTGILGHAQLLLEEWPPGDGRREPVEKIEQLARRCRDVTQKLLRFSQQRAEPDFQPIDLNRVAADALTLAEGQIRDAGIALEMDLGEPAPWVRGDAGHLAHVVLNLLSNARTACLGSAGRRVAVSTRLHGREARLTVRDDGKGISREVMPRIFEPFFTTKELWSNVGLGLSVTYRIVAEHGGRIDVESNPGQGSAFAVILPATSPPAV
ncbi:MAG TPA: sensor histidine kinase [Anaeromyxobacteraceae bacterium]|nr:sensor histidine kinase [Anaeromyxobacteraceae bacterium]